MRPIGEKTCCLGDSYSRQNAERIISRCIEFLRFPSPLGASSALLPLSAGILVLSAFADNSKRQIENSLSLFIDISKVYDHPLFLSREEVSMCKAIFQEALQDTTMGTIQPQGKKAIDRAILSLDKIPPKKFPRPAEVKPGLPPVARPTILMRPIEPGEQSAVRI